MADIILCGRVVRADDIKAVNDTHVLRFTVAEDRRKKDGEKYSVFWRCDQWGRESYLEKVAPYIQKGKYLTVFGEDNLSIWESDNGPKVNRDIKVSRIRLQGSSQEEARNEREEESSWGS